MIMEVINLLYAESANNFTVRANQFGALFEERVKKNRFLHQSPPTLFDLSMEAMANRWKYFVGNISWYDPLQDELNPFRHMPNVIVQMFLQKIALARKERNLLIHKYYESSFVKLLLNRHVTEFDMIKFNDECIKFDQEYFNHLSNCCPNIKRIRFYYNEDRDHQHAELSSILEMKKNWPNLIHLDLGGALFADEDLKEISLQFPQLAVLAFYSTDEFFTMKGVKELSKMRNLWRLNLRFERSDVDVNDALDLVVHAAGKVPNLKKFEFEIIPAGQDIDEAFVVTFGVLYKEKELCLCKISLCRLIKSWPSNLTVETLTLKGLWSTAGIQRFCSIITFPLKGLTLDNLLSRHIYAVVESLGSEILELCLYKCNVYNPKKKTLEALNLYRVLAACPKLESIKLACYGPIESSPTYNITALNFVNIKEFDIVAEPNYASEATPHRGVLKIYSMFLEGSKRHGRELVLSLPKQMSAIRNALIKKENCLQSVERVLMLFSDDIEGSLFVNVLRTTLLLTVSCPLLKIVHVSVCNDDRWAIYNLLERKYSGVNSFHNAIGVELRFSNPSVSASSSLETSRQNSDDDDDDSMLSLSHKNA